VRQSIEALSLNADLLSSRFDLALALMCAGRYELAVNEYRMGLQLVAKKNKLRQRGVLHVATDDLADAMVAHREFDNVSEVKMAQELLEKAYGLVKDIRLATLLSTRSLAEPSYRTP